MPMQTNKYIYEFLRVLYFLSRSHVFLNNKKSTKRIIVLLDVFNSCLFTVATLVTSSDSTLTYTFIKWINNSSCESEFSLAWIT
jgi:hypothetical protein